VSAGRDRHDAGNIWRQVALTIPVRAPSDDAAVGSQRQTVRAAADNSDDVGEIGGTSHCPCELSPQAMTVRPLSGRGCDNSRRRSRQRHSDPRHDGLPAKWPSRRCFRPGQDSGVGLEREAVVATRDDGDDIMGRGRRFVCPNALSPSLRPSIGSERKAVPGSAATAITLPKPPGTVP